MLIYSYYVDNQVDKAWFDSSNVFYAECDESDTNLKTVRIVFKNGAQYQYDNVDVNDWVMFKHAESQGKEMNKIFKKGGYSYSKIEDVNIDSLKEEYAFRSNNGYTLYIINNDLSLLDVNDSLKYTMPLPEDSSIIDNIKEMLESVGCVVRIKNDNPHG